MKFVKIFKGSFIFKSHMIFFNLHMKCKSKTDEVADWLNDFELGNYILPSNMSMMHSVFVYGTLKKGEPNHYWLEAKENGHARFISKGKTIKKYPLVIASKYNIPFLLHSAGRGENVIGEVYEVDEKMLSHLDILEDHPTFYVREIDQVQTLGQKEENLIDCWIYFLKKFKLSLLDEQCYVEYHSEGSHLKPYTPREQRIPGYHAKTDVLL